MKGRKKGSRVASSLRTRLEVLPVGGVLWLDDPKGTVDREAVTVVARYLPGRHYTTARFLAIPSKIRREDVSAPVVALRVVRVTREPDHVSRPGKEVAKGGEVVRMK